jgi:hypothetical protein
MYKFKKNKNYNLKIQIKQIQFSYSKISKIVSFHLLIRMYVYLINLIFLNIFKKKNRICLI